MRLEQIEANLDIKFCLKIEAEYEREIIYVGQRTLEGALTSLAAFVLDKRWRKITLLPRALMSDRFATARPVITLERAGDGEWRLP